MDPFELIIFIPSIYLSLKYLIRWYSYTFGSQKLYRNTFVQTMFCIVPVLAAIINLYTLTVLASFDVVDSSLYITFYFLIGLVWLFVSIFMIFVFFNLSWIDDALNMKNPGAALAIAGGGLGATLIYAGSNIGDGPGWWCVFFAGGLGLAWWFLLGMLANWITKIFKKITVERDIFCGIRTGAYLLSGGIILGRASGGDWTSFSKTVEEFLDGWPVLILTALFILIELLLKDQSAQDGYRAKTENSTQLAVSLSLGVFYITAAICAVYFLPPLPINPIYRL